MDKGARVYELKKTAPALHGHEMIVGTPHSPALIENG